MANPDRHDRFSSLIEEHRRILHKVAGVYCRQREDRNDLVQEIIVQLWRSFDRYDPRLRFSTWMYRIALNVAISCQRRARTRHRHTPLADVELLQEIAEPEAAAPPEEVEQLYRFIDRFDDLNKALMLLYLDGIAHAGIAEILGISATNVATKINRLKNKLRDDFRAAGSS